VASAERAGVETKRVRLHFEPALEPALSTTGGMVRTRSPLLVTQHAQHRMAAARARERDHLVERIAGHDAAAFVDAP
jgi:hypothetical protein